jgi:putative exporter of polyketide antibiotics
VRVSGSHITLGPARAWRRMGYVLGIVVAMLVVMVVVRRYRVTQRQRAWHQRPW